MRQGRELKAVGITCTMPAGERVHRTSGRVAPAGKGWKKQMSCLPYVRPRHVGCTAGYVQPLRGLQEESEHLFQFCRIHSGGKRSGKEGEGRQCFAPGEKGLADERGELDSQSLLCPSGSCQCP